MEGRFIWEELFVFGWLFFGKEWRMRSKGCVDKHAEYDLSALESVNDFLF